MGICIPSIFIFTEEKVNAQECIMLSNMLLFPLRIREEMIYRDSYKVDVEPFDDGSLYFCVWSNNRRNKNYKWWCLLFSSVYCFFCTSIKTHVSVPLAHVAMALMMHEEEYELQVCVGRM